MSEPLPIKHDYKTLEAGYPTFCLYPPYNPQFGFRKPAPPTTEEQTLPIVVSLRSKYPAIDLYSPVYPFIEPYPLQVPAELPIVDLYSPVYPFIEPYPSQVPAELPIVVSLPSKYPAIDLYSPVYPFVEPYPLQVPTEIQVPSGRCTQRTSTTGTHKDLYEVAHSDGTISSMSGPGTTTSDHVRKSLPARVYEEPRLIRTPSHAETTTEKPVSPNPYTTDSRAATSTRHTTRIASQRPISEHTMPEASSGSMTSTRAPRTFSTIHTSSPTSQRGLPERPPAGVRPRPNFGRSLGLVKESVPSPGTHLVSRSRIGSVDLEHRESLGGNVVERSGSLGQITTNKPPVRRRDSLVWQRARAFDDKTRADSYDAPTRITLETLSKFPMPPIPLPRPPQKSHKHQVPIV